MKYRYYTQADPAVQDNDGSSPQLLAVNISPRISALFNRVKLEYKKK
jgi:hypothetical protein